MSFNLRIIWQTTCREQEINLLWSRLESLYPLMVVVRNCLLTPKSISLPNRGPSSGRVGCCRCANRCLRQETISREIFTAPRFNRTLTKSSGKPEFDVRLIRLLVCERALRDWSLHYSRCTLFRDRFAMDRSPIGRLDYDDDSKRQAGVVLRSSEAYVRRQSSLFALSRRKQGKILGTETRRTIANAEGRHDLGREACYSVASCNSFSIRTARLRLFCT